MPSVIPQSFLFDLVAIVNTTIGKLHESFFVASFVIKAETALDIVLKVRLPSAEVVNDCESTMHFYYLS